MKVKAVSSVRFCVFSLHRGEIGQQKVAVEGWVYVLRAVCSESSAKHAYGFSSEKRIYQ